MMVKIKKPEDWSEERWQKHLKLVEAWDGYDGLSAEEVSEILMEANEEEA
jgi:hypothetical protein